MKVLLISANTTAAPYPVYPIGLDYVAGALDPRHEVCVLDMNVAAEADDLEATIRAFGPRMIGLSIRNIDNVDTVATKTFVPGYQALAGRIRECTSAPLVLGGSGFSIFPAVLMSLLEADFGVIGEGEVLNLLIEALEAGADPLGLPGVVTRAAPAVPAPRPWAGRIARRLQPSPAQLDFYLKHGGMLNLQTQRGCPHRCLYCTYPYLDGHRLRAINPDEVAATARRLQDLGAAYLFITDSVFNTDTAHGLAVARAFRRHGVTVPWGAFFAPVPAPDGYYAALAEAGLTHVEFGTESLSETVLKRYGKPFSVADVSAAHASARAASLHIAHYLMMGGPGEDGRTVDETLGQAERMEGAVFFFFCGVRVFPFTPLAGIARREGQVRPDDDLLAPVFYRSAGIAAEEILARVNRRAGGRSHWVRGDGGLETERILSRLHAHGHAGPLWELLLR